MAKKSLGEALVEKGLLKPQDLQDAIKKQNQESIPLRKAILNLGVVSEKDLVNIEGEVLGISVIIELLDIVDPEIIEKFPEDLAKKHICIPLFKAEDLMMVAVVDPMDLALLDEIKKVTGMKVEPVLSLAGEIEKAIEKFYGEKDRLKEIMDKGEGGEDIFETAEDEDKKEPGKDKESTEIEAPIVRLVNTIITDAVKKGASDIHVEPEEEHLRVRYRIDGVLREVMTPPKKLQPRILSRIKIVSGMDIAEKRVPQDGRFKVRCHNKALDARVSSLPAVYGEKIVIRLLDQSSIHLKIEDLNFNPDDFKKFWKAIHQPNGIILVTGPTGSGKTTTLYVALEAINDPGKNIMTIEDPVEYRLKGINQVQVHAKIGVDFASILRTALRQDPNVIMVGEMRDSETGETAIRAALTGHLVFSTLHTNDAPSALTRLIDMGIQPYLVASAVTCILAQRLVRKICLKCKEQYHPDPDQLSLMGIEIKPGAKFYHGKGCDYCNNSGYKGRLGVYELLILDNELRKLIVERAAADVLIKSAKKNGMHSLLEEGMEKVYQGITTIDEVGRVLLSSHD